MRTAIFDGHPSVNFLFFSLMIGFTMFFTHPAYLLASLLGAFFCVGCLRGFSAAGKMLLRLLPLAVLTAAINALFNHAGQTMLFRLPDGNMLTLEALLNGASSAVLLAAVILWFAACTDVITSDQLLYLFGRTAPSLGLLLSMTLRFVPRFRKQLAAIREAQQGLGCGIETGSLRKRFQNGAAMLSALITWALENAIETADSMKSRGHGLPGRTSFSIYRLTPRDRAMLGWFAGCGFQLLCGGFAGGMRWQWFPAAGGAQVSAMHIWLLFIFLTLCLTPLVWTLANRRNLWTAAGKRRHHQTTGGEQTL